MAKTRKGIEKDLLASMAQAVAFGKGARRGYVVHTFTPDDVRRERRGVCARKATHLHCR